MDTCDQFILVEWLGHVVVGTEAEAPDLVLNTGHPREDENWRLYLGKAECTKNLVTGHVRQVEVQQNDIVIVQLT